MKKRLLILGMIFTMVVSSAGCGSSSSDNAGKTDQTKQTADVQDSRKTHLQVISLIIRMILVINQQMKSQWMI